jgi:hypothetical protein
LRVGLNLVDLHAMRADMPPALFHAVDAVLDMTHDHFAQRAALDRALPPPDALLQAIDRALDDVSGLTGPLARGTVRSLVGLRRALFTDAPAYELPAHEAVMAEAGEAV